MPNAFLPSFAFPASARLAGCTLGPIPRGLAPDLSCGCPGGAASPLREKEAHSLARSVPKLGAAVFLADG